MAINQKRRQQKLAQKKAKRKAEQKQLARLKSSSPTAVFQSLAGKPILHSFITDAVWDHGIGYVLLSRQLQDRCVALVNFLVDRYCLGVKDVHMEVVTKAEVLRYVSGICEVQSKQDVPPERARKLVESAVEYAAGLGIAPYPEYQVAQLIFAGIDSSNEPEFEFGCDGRPFFVPGPYDGPLRCQEIVRALTESCGRDNFDYVLGMAGPGDLPQLLREETDEGYN